MQEQLRGFQLRFRAQAPLLGCLEPGLEVSPWFGLAPGGLLAVDLPSLIHLQQLRLFACQRVVLESFPFSWHQRLNACASRQLHRS